MRRRRLKSTRVLSSKAAVDPPWAAYIPQGLVSSWRGQAGNSIFSGLVVPSAFRQGYSQGATAPIVAMGVAMLFAEALASLAGRVTTLAPSSVPKRTSLPPRHDEMRWIQANADELRALDGQWIVVEGTRLISSGPRLVEVVAEAEALGIRNPFVHRVETERPDVAHLGF